MKLDHYKISRGSRKHSYKFISEGPKGRIIKLVQFALIDPRGYYNLAFGEKDLVTGEINDAVVTDNGDTEKVLCLLILYCTAGSCHICYRQHTRQNTIV